MISWRNWILFLGRCIGWWMFGLWSVRVCRWSLLGVVVCVGSRLKDIRAVGLLQRFGQGNHAFLFFLEFVIGNLSLLFRMKIILSGRLGRIGLMGRLWKCLAWGLLFGRIHLLESWIYMSCEIICIFRHKNCVLLLSRWLVNFFRNLMDLELLKYDYFSFGSKFLRICLFCLFWLRDFP